MNVSPWHGRIACAAVALLAFVFAFNKIDDFDTWWHLAAGRWIAANGTIPRTDTLSHTVRDHAWINMQWGFDLLAYWMYRAGGAFVLCVAGAVAFAAAMLLMMRVLARHVPAAVAALVGVLVVMVAQERVALRPELLSFVLLASLFLVLDPARDRVERYLWAIVPLMLVWANVHALFVIGAFAIVCAAIGAGAVPSKKWLAVSAVALAVTLVNPFGIRGVLFPLQLISRINGSIPVFQIIPEFASPFAEGAQGISLVFYKILLAGVALTFAAAFLTSRRRDWGGLLFVIGLAVVSVAARRNIAMFAVGAACAAAPSLGALFAAGTTLRAWVLRRSALIGGVVSLVSAIGIVAEARGDLQRFDNQPREFGYGVIEGTFPTRAAAFARDAELPPTLYNDMASGGYLTWDQAAGGEVFIDGRLEVYDAPFITDVARAASNPALWQADADRFGVETAIVAHRFENGRALVGQLARMPGWTLVYTDEVACIFVRASGNEAAIARAAALGPAADAETAKWLSRPVATSQFAVGRVEATRAYARVQATLGRADAAIAAYQKYLELGPAEKDAADVRRLLENYFRSHPPR